MAGTQISRARKGEITREVLAVAREEGLNSEVLAERVTQGKVVVPCRQTGRNVRPTGIGAGLRVKVNANIGSSSDSSGAAEEVAKLKAALSAGTDTIMDLSTGAEIDDTRKRILAQCPVPLGTVPIYQAAIEVAEIKGGIVFMTSDDLFDVIERQAADGVDFMTVHCGVTLETLERLRRQGRITDIVSRGGAFLATWMVYNQSENPLYEDFDRLLDIARKYDVTLSLGDGLRPGCLADATDRPQVQELIVLGELTETAWASDVQVMIEGPGHVPLNHIEANVLLQKNLCKGAPFYVLGPLVTDIAPGYDHIVSAIGGAVAAYCGADFLCYVTPAEHLKLPTAQEVAQGVMAARIAAHAADLARGLKSAHEWDLNMARARKTLDWDRQMEQAIDPATAKALHGSGRPQNEAGCTMCGNYCAIKLVQDFLRGTSDIQKETTRQ